MRFLAIAALACAWASQTAAQPVTAEQVIQRGQERLRQTISKQGCTAPGEGDDIVVCAPGTDDTDKYRVPPSVDVSARTQAGGEQLSAMGVGQSRCSTVGFNQQCGHVDLLGVAAKVVVAIVEAVISDDE